MCSDFLLRTTVDFLVLNADDQKQAKGLVEGLIHDGKLLGYDAGRPVFLFSHKRIFAPKGVYPSHESIRRHPERTARDWRTLKDDPDHTGPANWKRAGPPIIGPYIGPDQRTVSLGLGIWDMVTHTLNDERGDDA